MRKLSIHSRSGVFCMRTSLEIYVLNQNFDSLVVVGNILKHRQVNLFAPGCWLSFETLSTHIRNHLESALIIMVR